MTALSNQKLKNTKYSIWLQKEVNNSIQQDFLNRIPLYYGWFHLFCYFWVMTLLSNQKLKTQNTVSGYKKMWKIQSHQIFWSAIPELWVVSFSTFASWPFYRRKIWETQNTVFGYKKESKFNPTRFSDSLPQMVCCFMLLLS